MSRSDYSEDCAGWSYIKWRGQVTSAIRGKRGQKFLKDLQVALETMPKKELISGALERNGQFCTLGAYCNHKFPGEKYNDLDNDALSTVADVAEPLIREIEFMNDEALSHVPPEQRHSAMLSWVKENIKAETTTV